jgi:hypothetical protein
MDKKFYEALTSSIYMNSMVLAGKSIETADQKIRVSGLYADFDEAKAYDVGDVFNTRAYEELSSQTWECHQAINPAHNPGVVPGSSAWFTFFHPLHGKSRMTARPFVQPQYGTTDIYKQGEWMIFTDGDYYECIAPNGTNFSPVDYPGGWRKDEA